MTAFRSIPAAARFLPISALVLLLLWGCAEYDTGTGSSLVGDETAGTLLERNIPVDQAETVALGDVFKSQTAPLFLGEQDGIRSHIILKYENFDALGDTVLEINDGRILLFSDDVLVGDAVSQDPWQAEVLRIEEEYNTITLEFDDAEALAVSQAIDTLDITWTGDLDSLAADSFEIVLDEETLDRWVFGIEDDTTDYRQGLYIRPLDGANFISRILPQASTSLTDFLPVLRINADFISGEDTLTDSTVFIPPTFDTFLVSDEDLTIPDELVIVTQGFARHALFRADFSQYLDPSLHSINRVDLVVTLDKEWSRTLEGTSPVPLTWADVTIEWDENPDSVRYGTASSLTYFIPDDKNTIRFNVTPVTRMWVAEPDSNYGLGIRPTILGLNLSRHAFYSESAADTTVRPYFHVTYTEYEAP